MNVAVMICENNVSKVFKNPKEAHVKVNRGPLKT